ncbi:MAG: hypothetical protein KatS3mg102_2313 [Planctomycetota bacterium]|nr:MAG: hypothetical protein KatS3mg102_2313 [Planctomycetota bacterium]
MEQERRRHEDLSRLPTEPGSSGGAGHQPAAGGQGGTAGAEPPAGGAPGASALPPSPGGAAGHEQASASELPTSLGALDPRSGPAAASELPTSLPQTGGARPFAGPPASARAGEQGTPSRAPELSALATRPPTASASGPSTASSGSTELLSPPPGGAGAVRARIGLYEVVEELGRGGMGAVYRAWHPPSRRFVALKVIRTESRHGSRFERLKALFLREGGILMGVHHPHVVRCYDVNEAYHEGRPVLYMALELLEGESLAQRLERGPLPPEQALAVARDVARALQALHQAPERILHRDVKPANVFLCRDGAVKLLDFGLAGAEDWRLTQVSVFAAGSRPYMAPEQFDGLRHCTERSDLYSLGVTLFQALTGRPPFEADTDQGFLHAHKHTSPPSIAEVRPELTASPLCEPAQRILTRLLAKRPEERYASAAEVVAALECALGGGEISRPRVTRPEAVRRRRRALAVLGTVLVLVLAAAAGRWIARRIALTRIDRIAQLLEQRRVEQAHRLVTEALADAPDDPRLVQLAAELEQSLELRRQLQEGMRIAEALAEGGRAREAAQRAEQVAQRAAASAVFDAEEVAALLARAQALERRRAEAFQAMADRARTASAGGQPSALAQALTALQLLARPGEQSESAALASWQRELQQLALSLGQRQELDRAAAELDAGALEAAAGRLSRLEEAALPAVLESLHALHAELEQVRGLRAELDRARSLLREDPAAARQAAGRVRAALEQAGPEGASALERRLGSTAEEIRALERAAARAAALAALAALPDGAPPERARQLVAEARAALVPGDAAGEAEVAAAERAACLRLYEHALAAARAALAGGGPEPERAAAAEALARRALHALPPAEAAAFAELARRFEQERAATGPGPARTRLREALRAPAHARAEAAWLLLEQAVALAGRRPEEQLVRRLEAIALGSPDADRNNPVHVVSLPPFYLETTEVEAGAYAEFVAGGGAAPPPSWGGQQRPPPERAREPVRGVGFAEARAYAAYAGKRLPLADEWEAAASVEPAEPSRRRLYPWGEEWLADLVEPVADPRGASARSRPTVARGAASTWAAGCGGGRSSEARTARSSRCCRARAFSPAASAAPSAPRTATAPTSARAWIGSRTRACGSPATSSRPLSPSSRAGSELRRGGRHTARG